MRTEAEVRELLSTVLAHVSRGEAEAAYGYERLLATRFGENAITQNTSTAAETVSVEILDGRRRGAAATNRLDAASLADVVRRAAAIARGAPEDPEVVPLPGPQAYPQVARAFYEATDRLPPERVAEDVLAVVERSRARGFKASGLFQTTTRVDGIANSNGLFGYHRATQVDDSTTVHGPNGSGKARQTRNDHGQIDIARLAETAVANAALAQDPVALPPGDYTVILEPLAAAQLLEFVLTTMTARDAEEGTTPFAGAVGTRLVSDKVSLRLPVDDPDLPAMPYGEAGLAARPTTWIERGVVRRLYHDRFWAAEKGVEADPSYGPLVMDGEDRDVEDLVRACRRGLLVKNLWYIRFVDPRSLVLTGMTRDGLFLVEDGEVVGPVRNMRWNESPLTLLRNVVGLSRGERVADWLDMRVPGVMSEGFTFTSATESV